MTKTRYDSPFAVRVFDTKKACTIKLINMNNFYVYVYIDPRNFEEFYYGKGKGWRKEAHLWDTSSSEKTKRIKAI
jgi:hypothetical protein